ncbi:MAG: hypothetical protein WDN02_06925 [Methylovirgula sp.]|uniref:hypothetical protein n=1 Tax=Methylovirgula sp. TaxID=1978224 RepID=UPI0030765044
MGVLETIENAIETTEADVESWIVAIIKGEKVVASKLEAGLNWLASNTPAISAGVASVETMVESIVAATPGAAQNATVTKAIADANEAVAGLNAFANAANTGSNQAQAVVAGYVAYQSAAAAVAGAKAAVAATPAATAPAA